MTQDDTWTWDGEQWQHHTPSTRPPPLSGASAVSDPERGVVWMFGGSDGREARGDLWQWDGSDWTLVVREPAPGPMPHSAMAFDSSSRTVLLYGGTREPGTTDWSGETWRWDGASWSRLGEPTVEPTCYRACSMVFEPDGRALLVNTGSTLGTWRWDGAAWTRAAAPSAGFTPQRLVVDEDGVLALSILDPYGPTRARWDGSAWTPTGERGGLLDFRAMPGGVYDRAHGRPVLYGGRDDWSRPMGDLMEHDGTRWRLRSPTPSFRAQTYAPAVLPPEGAHAVVWDGERVHRWTGDAFVAGESLADFHALTATTTGDVYGVRTHGSDTELVRRRAGVWTTLEAAPTPVGAIALAVHESSGVVLVAMYQERLRTMWSWDGGWHHDSTVPSDPNGVPQLAYDAVADVVVLTDGRGDSSVWSPSVGWAPAGAAGERALGRTGSGRVLSVGLTESLTWTTTGWTRVAEGSPLRGVVARDPATDHTLLVSIYDGSVYRLGADRWIPMPVGGEVLDFPTRANGAMVVVDRDSGRTVVDRIRSIGVDRAWVLRPTTSMFDGTRWVSGMASAAYAGPGRGVLVSGEGVWRWTSAGIEPLPQPADSLVLVGYDAATGRVVGVGSGATLTWDGTAWESSARLAGLGAGAISAATEPVSGVLHVLYGGLHRWSTAGWVLVEEMSDSTGLGAHDARGSLVLFGFNRDRGQVSVREGPPWVERDVRGELPPGVQTNGAYHGPSDSVLTWRHRLRLLSAVGLPCAGPSDCGGGFCVDGVCCDDPCADGARDCMACSVAQGGAMDGHCGPLALGIAEAVECRPSRDACDVAEHCSSESRICPGDAVAVDATSCDDGLGCNGLELCRGGVCEPGASPCDDADPCTIDACDEPGRCIHLVRPACCSVDAECGDEDGCTVDRCVDGACVHDSLCSDAGVDAGTDGGREPVDAGDDAPLSLADVSGDVGPLAPPPGGVAGGACGCRAAAPTSAPWLLPLASLVLLRAQRKRK